MTNLETIHPVILPVAADDRGLKGRAKVAALRREARKALALSAGFADCALGPLEKRDSGAPIPSDGIHWSLSHKSAYVAAVTARRPVGIDIEQIKPMPRGVHDRIAGPEEWALAPVRDTRLFFRYWTAKEAVLKAVGIGLTGLDDCRIRQIPDDSHLVVAHAGKIWTVTHYWVGQDHLVTLTSDGFDIAWHLLREDGPGDNDG